MSGNSTSVFNPWVPNWIKLPLLIIGLLPHLLLIGLFSGNAQFVASVLDADTNDLQFLMSIGYAAIVVALLIYLRFFAFFALRNFILLVVSCSVFILLFLVYVKSYIIIMPLRVVEGIFAIFEGLIFFPVLLTQIKSKNSRTIAYFILYALMLSSGPFTAWIFKFATSNFGWQEVFYIVCGFHITVLAITLYLFNGNRFFPKKPLYQVDWISCMFLLISFISGVYVIIYGFRLNWFHASSAWYGTFLFFVSGALFIYRQLKIKHKIFFLETITFKSVQVAIVLFGSFYIIRFGYVNIYTTMIQIWKWPWEYVVNFQFINVAGVFIGVAASGILLLRGLSTKFIFAIGFLILAFNAHLISCLFDSDVDTYEAGKTVFIQGIGQGWLFTPLVMYIVGGVPAKYVNNATMLATSARFWFTNIGFAISQNAMYFFQEKNYDALKANIDVTRQIVGDVAQNKLDTYEQVFTNTTSELLMQNDLANLVYQQANLLASKQLFTLYFWLGLVTAIIILLTIPERDRIKTYLNRILKMKIKKRLI